MISNFFISPIAVLVNGLYGKSVIHWLTHIEVNKQSFTQVFSPSNLQTFREQDW